MTKFSKNTNYLFKTKNNNKMISKINPKRGESNKCYQGARVNLGAFSWIIS